MEDSKILLKGIGANLLTGKVCGQTVDKRRDIGGTLFLTMSQEQQEEKENRNVLREATVDHVPRWKYNADLISNCKVHQRLVSFTINAEHDWRRKTDCRVQQSPAYVHRMKQWSSGQREILGYCLSDRPKNLRDLVQRALKQTLVGAQCIHILIHMKRQLEISWTAYLNEGLVWHPHAVVQASPDLHHLLNVKVTWVKSDFATQRREVNLVMQLQNLKLFEGCLVSPYSNKGKLHNYGIRPEIWLILAFFFQWH